MNNDNTLIMYVIKDKVAGEAGPVALANNIAHAKRQYKDLCAKSVHKEDLELYIVGSYNPKGLNDSSRHFIHIYEKNDIIPISYDNILEEGVS